jgi:hypothetical protein
MNSSSRRPGERSLKQAIQGSAHQAYAQADTRVALDIDDVDMRQQRRVDQCGIDGGCIALRQEVVRDRTEAGIHQRPAA